MNKIQIIAKNIGLLFISQIVNIVLGFVYIIYTARYLGVAGFGIFSFALAFTGIFGVLSDLGLNMLTVREVSRDKALANKYLGNIIIIKVILALITLSIIFLTLNLLNYPQNTIEVVYLMALYVILGSFTGICYSIFQAYEKMEYQSLSQILNSILLFSGTLLAISLKFTVIGFALIYFVSSFIVFVFSIFICLWKFVLPKIEFNWTFWKLVIIKALPFGLTSIFVFMYYYIDTVMLSIMLPNGNEVVGWYNAAYRLVIPLSFIPAVFFSSVFPAMANFYKTSHESLKFAFKKSIKYMTIMGVPIAAATTVLADKIILIVYGASYIPATIALQILVWSMALIFVNTSFSTLLTSTNHQITVAKITAIATIFNIILNVILIPHYSYIGSSMATLAADMITLIIMVFILSKTDYKISITSFKDFIKVVVSTLLMIFIIKILGDTNIFGIVLIASVGYLATFLLIKGMDKDDIRILKNLLFKDS
ncbi:MAG: flippase [Methanobacterium paludis]|nr:flippase [Methanobacterium paludis]